MHKKLLRGLQFLACGALVALICGVATPAAADDSSTLGNIEGNNSNAYLTKVLSLKDGVAVRQAKNDGSGGYDADSYEFTFAGGGPIGQDMTSDGVLQTAPLVQNDEVPVLGDGGKVTLTAKDVDTVNKNAHQNGDDNSTFVYVIRQSLKDVVKDVQFAKPGIYTYRVTETGVNKIASGDSVGVTRSNASYLMKVTVKSDKNSGANVPTNIDVVKEKDDEGNTTGSDVYPQTNGKVDPAYPKVTSGDPTLIDTTTSPSSDILTSDLAPDNRGRNVYGFTFANEYVFGAAFYLKKEVGGSLGDLNKQFKVRVAFEDSSAPNNSRYVYQIYTHQRVEDTNVSTGYKDTWTAGDLKAAHFTNCVATIEEDLKDGDYISIVGVQGFNSDGQSIVNDLEQSQLAPGYEGRAWLGDGVVPNTVYTVSEGAYPHYRAAILTFDEGTPQEIDSTTTAHNPTRVATQQASTAITADGLKTDAGGKTVLVVNTYDDPSTNPTGIIIDNLPYVLMIGIPVAVFAVMFVSRRRNNDAAA